MSLIIIFKIDVKSMDDKVEVEGGRTVSKRASSAVTLLSGCLYQSISDEIISPLFKNLTQSSHTLVESIHSVILQEDKFVTSLHH